MGLMASTGLRLDHLEPEPKFKIYFGFYGAESAAESRLENFEYLLLKLIKYKEN